MHTSWIILLKETYKRHRVLAAYIIVWCSFALRFLDQSKYVEIGLGLLAVILLPAFFEIHRKVIGVDQGNTFESFNKAVEKLYDEIDRLSKKHKRLTIRYFGIAGYHWPYVRDVIIRYFKESTSSAISLELLMIDPSWDASKEFNDTWQKGVAAVNAEIERFRDRENRLDAEIRHYRSAPQFWGVLINDETLFLSATFFRNGRLVASNNPCQLFVNDASAFDKVRIQEFVSWFEYFWSQQAPTADKPA